MLDAAELLRRGRLTANQGRLASARRHLETARRRTDDPELLAQVQTTLGYVDAESGEIALALSRVDEVLRERRATERTRGLALSQRALLHLRLGDHPAAIVDFERAVPDLAGCPEDLGRLFLNRGVHLMQTGHLDEAAEDLRAAAENLRAAGSFQAADKAGFNLAYISLLNGDLVAALKGMDEWGSRLAESGPVNAAVYLQDRAEVLLAAGLAHEAESALAEAARTYAARRLGQFQAEAELLRARTLLRMDEPKAAAVARRAARIFRRRGAESFALRADLIVLTAQVSTGRRTPALLATADALAADLAAMGLRQDAVLARLQGIRVMLARGELEAASTRLRRVRVAPTDRLELRLLARELRAELAAARRHPGRSLGHIRAGLADLHDWQSSFGSLDLQSTLVGHGRHLAVLGLRHARASGSAEAMLEWSERARALVNRVTPVRPPDDPELASLLSQLRALLATSPAPGSAGERRTARLRDQIRQRSWYGEGSREVSEPATAEQVVAALAHDDAALVAHVVIDSAVVAVVATGECLTLRELGPLDGLPGLLSGTAADLDMAASAMGEQMREVVEASVRRDLGELDERLMRGLRDLIGDRRVLLTPSGVLAGTPWSLLDTLRGRPVTLPRTATHWLAARARAPITRAQVGFVVGPGVPRAEEEVTRAAANWSRDRVRRPEHADAAAMVRIADEVDILHVSAHGHHVTETPLFAGVELDDGAFYGYDIDRVRRVPEVVLLSACEVGRGSVRAAEETVGMTAAWLHAGARSVIAAPNLLADDTACEVLAEVHRGLAAGRAPADALAAASALNSRAPVPLACYGAGW